MPDERSRGEEQRDGGTIQECYLCWILCGKHKQKQNPPCCHSGPPAGLSVTAGVSQVKCLLSHGFTPQTRRWYIRPDKQLRLSTGTAKTQKLTWCSETHSTGRHIPFLGLSLISSLTEHTHRHRYTHTNTARGHLKFLSGFYSRAVHAVFNSQKIYLYIKRPAKSSNLIS